MADIRSTNDPELNPFKAGVPDLPMKDTVRIKHDGFPDGLVINAEDFHSENMELFVAGQKAKK